MVKRVLVRSIGFLLSSLIQGLIVFLLLSVVVLAAVLVALVTGWYSLDIQSDLLGIDVRVDGRASDFSISAKTDLVRLLIAGVIAGLLSRIVSAAARALKGGKRPKPKS